MYVSCHSGYRKPDMLQTHATFAPGIPEAIIVSYMLILLRLWLLRRCFFVGMLTGQKNYRIINAVVVRFYRLVAIPINYGACVGMTTLKKMAAPAVGRLWEMELRPPLGSLSYWHTIP